MIAKTIYILLKQFYIMQGSAATRSVLQGTAPGCRERPGARSPGLAGEAGPEENERTKVRMREMKRLHALLMAVTLALALVACVVGDPSAGSSGTTTISFNGDSITVDGSGAAVDKSTVTITSAGTYSLSGTLDDGQVKVNAGDADTVRLVLSGVDISCSTGAPIYIASADKTIITLASGTANTVTDGPSYTSAGADSGEPDAALFSKDDLTINGEGSLAVTGTYNDGITCKDDLKINGGSIAVKAVNDGIRGRDSVTIGGGEVSVTAGGDGIQSNNDEDTGKGYIAIEGGSVRVSAGADGIQAELSLSVTGGDITIASGRDSAADSGKGLKAGVSVTVTGGTLSIDSTDDAVHSDGSISIQGGALALSSGDDAVHADSSLEIGGGEIAIARCYEGLDSAAITINGGDIHVVASDDGVNAVTKGAVSGEMQRPGRDMAMGQGTNTLSINGGYLFVDAGGDGLDINGPITMTGGTVIVNGPTDNGNGAVDYTGSFTITGGTFLAAGSSGMAMAPSASSSQPSVMILLASAQPAGTLVHIETVSGDDVLMFRPSKTYQSLVFSSPLLVQGTDYVVYAGGSASGTESDGVYTAGSYNPGTKIAEFSLADIVTTVGSAANQVPGMKPHDMQGNRTGNMTGSLPGAMGNPMTGNRTGNMPGYTPGSYPGGISNPMAWNASRLVPGYMPGSSVSRVIPGVSQGVPGMNNGNVAGTGRVLPTFSALYAGTDSTLRAPASYRTVVPTVNAVAGKADGAAATALLKGNSFYFSGS